jgi:hypothetical protein
VAQSMVVFENIRILMCLPVTELIEYPVRLPAGLKWC